MTDAYLPAGRDVTVEHGHLTELAYTRVGDDTAVSILRDDAGRYFAAPVVGDRSRRAVPGDGASEALVRALAGGRTLDDGFSLSWWYAEECTGESGIAVDQTNESVIVGDSAVVKWSVEIAPGPHPSPQRLATLADAGFDGMPRPWGVLTWQPSAGDEPRLVAIVDEYVPGAVDGWEWAVGDVRTALVSGSESGVRDAATRLGTLIGDLHAALATAGRHQASSSEAAQLAADAHAELDEAVRLTDGVEGKRLRYRADRLHRLLDDLRNTAGSALIDVHGDLHVGQVLRADDRYAVIDFDGNPVLEAAGRLARQPAATDVAGMLQSLDNVGHVVVRRTDGADRTTVSRLTAGARGSFLEAYRETLATHGESDLLDESLLVPLRIRQICREYLYAAKHLPRWLYVPDAAVIGFDE